MTVMFIKKGDRTVTHYASFDVETEEQRQEVIDYYRQQVKLGKIYGFTTSS